MTKEIDDNSICPECKWIDPDGSTCAAFPEGIPDKFLNGSKEHRTRDAGQITDITFDEAEPTK